MVAVKKKQPAKLERPFIIKAGEYLLWAYWITIAVIYLTVDLFIDLYTSYDFGVVAWYAAAISIPLAALTLYYIRKDVFGKWYTYILSPLIAFGLYLGCTYFNALNLDLIISAAFRPATQQELPIDDVQQVFAKKAGFIHTDVTLTYRGRAVVFQATRSSYFLLRSKKELSVNIGQSYFGNYFGTGLQFSAQQRWVARYQYIKDWFYRYLWLLIGFPLIVFLGVLKDRFFPSPPPDPKQVAHPYRKFFNLLLIIILSVFGFLMLVLLLIGLFM